MTRIIVFQQKGSGKHKIKGIQEYGKDIVITRIIDIDEELDTILDNPETYIPTDIEGDLVLSFLTHPDLIDYLALTCKKKKITMIASGKKVDNALTPFTCCGLGRHDNLGAYGDQFGLPEFDIEVHEGRVSSLSVRRGASCGATWEAVSKVIGLPVEEALPTLAREIQYLCCADPSAFDPISGKSALHYAGKVHIAALKKALTTNNGNNS